MSWIGHWMVEAAEFCVIDFNILQRQKNSFWNSLNGYHDAAISHGM